MATEETNINDIARQLTTASRLVLATDFFWIYAADGQQVKIPASQVKAYFGLTGTSEGGSGEEEETLPTLNISGMDLSHGNVLDTLKGNLPTRYIVKSGNSNNWVCGYMDVFTSLDGRVLTEIYTGCCNLVSDPTGAVYNNKESFQSIRWYRIFGSGEPAAQTWSDWQYWGNTLASNNLDNIDTQGGNMSGNSISVRLTIRDSTVLLLQAIHGELKDGDKIRLYRHISQHYYVNGARMKTKGWIPMRRGLAKDNGEYREYTLRDYDGQGRFYPESLQDDVTSDTGGISAFDENKRCIRLFAGTRTRKAFTGSRCSVNYGLTIVRDDEQISDMVPFRINAYPTSDVGLNSTNWRIFVRFGMPK